MMLETFFRGGSLSGDGDDISTLAGIDLVFDVKKRGQDVSEEGKRVFEGGNGTGRLDSLIDECFGV